MRRRLACRLARAAFSLRVEGFDNARPRINLKKRKLVGEPLLILAAIVDDGATDAARP